jgi:hypothetical protein
MKADRERALAYGAGLANELVQTRRRDAAAAV